MTARETDRQTDGHFTYYHFWGQFDITWQHIRYIILPWFFSLRTLTTCTIMTAHRVLPGTIEHISPTIFPYRRWRLNARTVWNNCHWWMWSGRRCQPGWLYWCIASQGFYNAPMRCCLLFWQNRRNSETEYTCINSNRKIIIINKHPSTVKLTHMWECLYRTATLGCPTQ